ncbi:MAG TPA: thioredoxin domain-containing protein [Polyangia bacterium]
MRNESIVSVDHNNFGPLTASDVPVLLEFSAVWCAPCRAIKPHLEALAAQHAGRIQIGKVDVDDDPALAARFEVRSLPTLLMFRHGQVVGQLVGAVPRARIADLVERALQPVEAAPKPAATFAESAGTTRPAAATST